MDLRLGVDIGGTNTCAGVVDSHGQVVFKDSFATRDYPCADAYADALSASIQKLIRLAETSLGIQSICWKGLGIGAPNGNILNGSIVDPPNLKFKGTTPLVAMLQQRLDLNSIVLTNDANAAAVGEHVYGAAQNYADFIMITLGTGLGSGIFVNHQLVYGNNGLAGELGHMTVVPHGRYCGFGRRGSLENYCSANGIRRTFFERMAERGAETSLDHLPVAAITAQLIAEAAQAGDATAQETMQLTGTMLGAALASVALFTSPAAFFLFGGPVQAGTILLDPLRRAFEHHLVPTYKESIEIIESALPPGEAAILGAAALVDQAD